MYSLYVKEHNQTGLKYLGQTKQNPDKYWGSGRIWKNHLGQIPWNKGKTGIYSNETKRLMGLNSGIARLGKKRGPYKKRINNDNN